MMRNGETQGAHDILLHGAKQLLANHRFTESSELLSQMIPSCTSSKILTDTIVSLLLPYLDIHPFPPSLEKSLELALSHSVTLFASEHPHLEGPSSRAEYPGSPFIHGILALLALRRGDTHKATEHFVRSDRISEFAQLSMQWLAAAAANAHQESDHGGPKIPPEILFTRTVLEFCAVGRLGAANAFVAHLKDAGAITSASPLIQFCLFVLRVLEREALPLFQQIERYYQPAYQQDPVILKHLATIANVYYSEVRRRSPASGLGGLGNLMQSMLGSLSS